MTYLKNIKAVTLPEEDTRIIAVFYDKWTGKSRKTNEVRVVEEVYIGVGEMNVDNSDEYIFDYQSADCIPDELTMPRSGYIKRTTEDPDDESIDIEWEIYVVDYVTVSPIVSTYEVTNQRGYKLSREGLTK